MFAVEDDGMYSNCSSFTGSHFKNPIDYRTWEVIVIMNFVAFPMIFWNNVFRIQMTTKFKICYTWL